MQLWVGLGNPGAKYALQRHNVGFMAADVIAEVHDFGPWQKKFRGLIADGQERGYLTFEEIATCLEEVEVTKEQVTDRHNHIVEQGIDVIAANGVTAYKESKGAEDGSNGAVNERMMFEPSATGEEALKVAVGATLSIVTLAVYSVVPPSLSLIFPFTVREPLSFVEHVAELVPPNAP